MSTEAESSATTAACCEACGRHDPIRMGDRWLCAECISTAGSCCPEFGAWDAWSQEEGVAPRCFVSAQ
ncbi:MAG: hypothetical protein K1X78_24945 [Verrucomicrobiaceae bacterium]|nr:hypothetical protein [Verrucomicrobiaceae bacterium]